MNSSSSSDGAFLSSGSITLRSPLAINLLPPPLLSVDGNGPRNGEGSDERSVEDRSNYQRSFHQQHNTQLRPVVSFICVASRVLEISIETRFQAAVLLHRYHLQKQQFGAQSNSPSVTTKPTRKGKSNKGKLKGGTDSSANSYDWTRSSCTGASCKEYRWIAAACLFLACKSQEEHRRLRDVINCAQMIEWGDEDDAKDGGDTYNGTDPHHQPPVQLKWNSHLLVDLDESYWNAKEDLVRTEQQVLRYLAFDVSVSRPYRAVVIVVDEMLCQNDSKSRSRNMIALAKVFSNKKKDLIRYAWQRLNDSVFCIESISHKVMPMAAAAVQLSVRSVTRSMSRNKSAKACATGGSTGCDANSSAIQPHESNGVASMSSCSWEEWIPVGVNKIEVQNARLDLEYATSTITARSVGRA